MDLHILFIYLFINANKREYLCEVSVEDRNVHFNSYKKYKNKTALRSVYVYVCMYV
jgi:hypothetical protein